MLSVGTTLKICQLQVRSGSARSWCHLARAFLGIEAGGELSHTELEHASYQLSCHVHAVSAQRLVQAVHRAQRPALGFSAHQHGVLLLLRRAVALVICSFGRRRCHQWAAARRLRPAQTATGVARALLSWLCNSLTTAPCHLATSRWGGPFAETCSLQQCLVCLVQGHLQPQLHIKCCRTSRRRVMIHAIFCAGLVHQPGRQVIDAYSPARPLAAAAHPDSTCCCQPATQRPGRGRGARHRHPTWRPHRCAHLGSVSAHANVLCGLQSVLLSPSLPVCSWSWPCNLHGPRAGCCWLLHSCASDVCLTTAARRDGSHRRSTGGQAARQPARHLCEVRVRAHGGRCRCVLPLAWSACSFLLAAAARLPYLNIDSCIAHPCMAVICTSSARQ